MKHIQAKHVDEAAILRMLLANIGAWHTHSDGFAPYAWTKPSDAPQRGPLFPGPMEYPEKVIRAKLESMVRRGLIDGGGRGDWHVPNYTRDDADREAKARSRLKELEGRR